MSGSTPEELPPIHAESLDSIEGLDVPTQQYLQERLGIQSLQDLAQASAEDIEAALRGSDVAISMETAISLIDNAQQLLGSAEATVWQTRVSFLLKFQTRIVEGSQQEQIYAVCQDSDEAKATFPEIDGKAAQDWMVQEYQRFASSSASENLPDDENVTLSMSASDESVHQANVAIVSYPPSPEDESFPTTELSLSLNVLKVSLFQPPGARIPIILSNGVHSLPRPLMAREMFDFEIFFELPEMVNTPLPAPVKYQIEGFAKSLDSSGSIISLGESQPTGLRDYESYYETLLPDVSLPPGLYRVQLLINFSGAPIPFGFYDSLQFHVVQ